MVVYYFMWLIILIPYLCAKNRHSPSFKRHYAVYVFICIALLIGLKAISVGVDTKQYEHRYTIVEEMIEPGKAERGYSYFSYVFRQLGFSFQSYYFVVACLLSSILIFFYATYSKNVAFSALIFMTIGLLPMYMSGVRQSLAISICLLSIMVVDKRRTMLALIVAGAMVYLASTFHVSSIVFLLAVAFVFLRLRLSRQAIILLVALAAASLVYRNFLAGVIQRFVPIKYDSIDLYESYSINPLLIIISILIPLFCIIFDTGIEKDGKYSTQTTWMYCFSCVNILLTILAQNSMYFSRMAYYFVHVNSLLIPNMIESQRLKSNSYIMYIVLALICMLYFIISIPGGTLQIDNYVFFWQQDVPMLAN